MSILLLASQTRIFDWKAQDDFAFFSGDRNPWHMDAIAARRTQAGYPVVHGMHAVLWALEVLARDEALRQSVARVNVVFHRFIHVGDEVAIKIVRQDTAGIRLQLWVDGLKVTSLKLIFGEAKLARTQESVSGIVHQLSSPEEPAVLSLEQLNEAGGRLTFARGLDVAANFFPELAAAIGPRRVAGLACMSRLVGMVCPGLHSIFSGFNVNTVDLSAQPDAICFQVTGVDERVRFINQSVEGGGWSGTIDCFARVAPVVQAPMKQIGSLIGKNEFEHASALIVGGSRGLGELTAKLIAAGGGAVTITYAVGRAEAVDVQRQIREWGGKCEILQYDATKPAEEQLSHLEFFPASLYYFATPFVARRKSGLHTQSVLNDFLSVYVSGFHNLLKQLSRMSDNGLTVFYPSSVAVEECPAEMIEYAMAKAAGEVLCANIARFSKDLRVVVERLPRMLTDQTAVVFPIETAEPLNVMLPIIRRVEIGR